MRRKHWMWSLSALSGVVISCMAHASALAQFVFLAPSPYLSAADSPFPLDSSPSFVFEDFEDAPGCVPGPGSFCGGGKLDAPGVRMVNGNTGQGMSVDADDGLIDGSGAEGASASATSVYFNPDMKYWLDAIELEFDADVLGSLPTAVGFVLTSGAGEHSGLTVYDAQGEYAYFDTSGLVLDSSVTSDDRFIGIINPNGIARVTMGRLIFPTSGDFTSPRLDHLQYGLWIPEPGGAALAGTALGILGVLVGRRRGARR